MKNCEHTCYCEYLTSVYRYCIFGEVCEGIEI